MLDRQATLALLARHGLEPRRSLGQNFVVDVQLVEEIVEVARVDRNTDVVEIGPGLGSMTRLLVASARRVVAIEKDATLFPLLDERLADVRDTVELVEADAMTVDWSGLLGVGSEWVLVANLPYNVAVPLIMRIMGDAPMVRRAVVMVQKEVADRLTAGPGGRTIGAPTIHLAWYARARTLIDVPPTSFHPPPRVDSAVMEIMRRPPPSDSVEVGPVMDLVDKAFRQRRKMLRSSLGKVVESTSFDVAGIDPTARPEELSLEQWVTLAEAVRGNRTPK